MKINHKKSIIALSCLVMLGTGCTKRFDTINTNPAGVTDDVFLSDFQSVVMPLKNAQRSLVCWEHWRYQLQQNLNADIYSGYMMTPTPFNGNNNNSNYFMMDGWNEWVLNIAFDGVMQSTFDYFKNAPKYKTADLSDADAMAKILNVIEMHRVSDIFGPVIYTKFAKPNADLTVDYDSQKDAYNAFFADLDYAADKLKPYVAGTKTASPAFKSADLVYGGDPKKWNKLVNTLRLRLALRIKYADLATAKTQGEKALNPANGGLLTAVADNALVDYKTESPIGVIINSWGDIRSGAPLASLMNGYNDPRIGNYMTKATDPAVNGQYIGIRNGVDIDGKDRYSGYSKPLGKSSATDYFNPQSGKAKLASAAEAAFLKAEAALEGWANAGDIKDNYEMGIDLSFEEWGAGSAAAYKSDDVSKAAPYVDPKSKVAGANNVPAGNANLSTITIKWDGAAGKDVKLERIITQKWIALYPDGQEAWTEFRRTGFPKLFPVVLNNSAGAIPGFIQRLPIPSKYVSSNTGGYQRAIATLGGPDNGGTKLWWNKKP
ncbi:SusD/RagB family nutrient-binding outer membrane lipoprotein [Pseudoflavitalea sp. G-6-1-2]|uniref:SusD/RagB family nutrient-binding outer membrane lipoprotein n=1 Tax=Pseudoflavitalea sp. G-6-1-2 TaxID=2728841 RepID=UPI00146E6E59|nr:SusD/RagB family nutrient-binding outer membrane lipoprotein [Pseudoflavitalea sp. G-6-1-2]NML21972.1 SusD/RagB family nutrient-binding outer membrane lipoprotein [Pseudoflavitalea sp. G-6-1-2]